jgi:hypothetical protein
MKREIIRTVADIKLLPPRNKGERRPLSLERLDWHWKFGSDQGCQRVLIYGCQPCLLCPWSARFAGRLDDRERRRRGALWASGRTASRPAPGLACARVINILKMHNSHTADRLPGSWEVCS